jgi:hypothetical protein
MLTGLLIGMLLSLGSLVTGGSPNNPEPTNFIDLVLFALATFLTGIFLGALVSWLQISAMKNSLNPVKPIHWIIYGSLGLGLASMAFAWAFSSSVFANPALIAVLFSASVYGLASALPQTYLMKSQLEVSWRWLMFNFLAAAFTFPLAFSPVWIPEGQTYFVLIFPLTAVGGMLFGFLKEIESRSWSRPKIIHNFS